MGVIDTTGTGGFESHLRWEETSRLQWRKFLGISGEFRHCKLMPHPPPQIGGKLAFNSAETPEISAIVKRDVYSQRKRGSKPPIPVV